MITIKNRNTVLLGIIKDLERALVDPKLSKKLQKLYKTRILVLDESIIDNVNRRT